MHAFAPEGALNGYVKNDFIQAQSAAPMFPVVGATNNIYKIIGETNKIYVS
jgi:hypothetical protein